MLSDGAIKKVDAHAWEREINEHYVEPHWCSERLFWEESFQGEILDPCCGFGRIVESAKKAGLHASGSDIVDRGYRDLLHTADFLGRFPPYENIVCNPPFNAVDKFALHALANASVRKVAMIFPTARLNAAHWLKETPLARVWLMTPRPSMPPGHTIAAGQKPGEGKMDFCWLVWERGFIGETSIKWLRRDGVISKTKCE